MAQLNQPVSVTVDRSGDIFIADAGNHNLRRVAVDGTISTMANTPGRNSIDSFSVAIDSSGNTYIADTRHNVVRKITSAGVTIFAGTGEAGYSGDGGPAAAAMLDAPRGVTADRWGNVYIADSRNDAVRRVDEHGVITTFAGNGTRQYHGDEDMIGSVAYTRDRGSFTEGAPATAAQLFWPMDVAVDAAGNVYIADDGNHVVERVTPLPHKEKRHERTVIDAIGRPAKRQLAAQISYTELAAVPLPAAIMVVPAVVPATVAAGKDDGGAVPPAGVLAAAAPEAKRPTVQADHIAPLPTPAIATPAASKPAQQLAVSSFKDKPAHEAPLQPQAPEPEFADDAPAAPVVKAPVPIKIMKLHVLPVQKMHLRNFTADVLPVAVPEISITSKEDPKTYDTVTVPVVQDTPLPPPDDPFNVYADPDAEELIISTMPASYTSLSITDVAGKTLLRRQITATETRVDVSKLEPSRYYINLKKGDKIKTATFVKDN